MVAVAVLGRRRSVFETMLQERQNDLQLRHLGF